MSAEKIHGNKSIWGLFLRQFLDKQRNGSLCEPCVKRQEVRNVTQIKDKTVPLCRGKMSCFLYAKKGFSVCSGPVLASNMKGCRFFV